MCPEPLGALRGVDSILGQWYLIAESEAETSGEKGASGSRDLRNPQ